MCFNCPCTILNVVVLAGIKHTVPFCSSAFQHTFSWLPRQFGSRDAKKKGLSPGKSLISNQQLYHLVKWERELRCVGFAIGQSTSLAPTHFGTDKLYAQIFSYETGLLKAPGSGSVMTCVNSRFYVACCAWYVSLPGLAMQSAGFSIAKGMLLL